MADSGQQQESKAALEVRKIKERVAKFGTGEQARVTVELKQGKPVKGYVSQASENTFSVRNKKSGDEKAIAYNDVQFIGSDGFPTKLVIGIGIAIGVVAILAVRFAQSCGALCR